jgi:two-component system, NarL family, invasion response regulator UvrY
MHTTIKIALADDQLLLAEALAAVINGFDNCQVLYTAANGQELIDKITAGPYEPDVLILDLAMPIMDGYDTAAWLQANRPAIKILMLTMLDTDTALVRLLKYGVKGFVKKDAHPNELRQAIHNMATTGYYYNSGTAGRLATLVANDAMDDIRMKDVDFTPEEKQLLGYFCTELTYKQIAAKMHLSPSMVDKMRGALCTRIAVRSRVGLALYAIRQGIAIPQH